MSETVQVLLDDLKTYKTWRRARIGSLVKVRIKGESTIGMRCQLPSTGGRAPMDLLLALTGDSMGQLLRDGNPQPAFDVSSVFDLTVENPMGVEFTREHWAINGIVAESGAGSGLLLARVPLDEQRLYVWLHDPEDKAKRGEVLNETMPDLVAWGTLGIAKKPRLPALGADPVV
jgi:hypothetical protein